MKLKRKWQRWRGAVAALLGGAVLGLAPAASAGGADDALGALAGVIGGTAMYNVYVNELLTAGNQPENQAGLFAYDATENGVDTNPVDTALVDRVMRRLVDQGYYVSDLRSLPFRWRRCWGTR